MSFFDPDKKPTYDVEAEDTAGSEPPAEETTPEATPEEGEAPEEEAARLAALARQNSTRAGIALILSILGLCCCGLPLGIPALILIAVDLRRRHVWDAITVSALVLSILTVVMGVAGVIYAAVLWDMLKEAFEAAGGAAFAAIPVTL